MIAFLFYKKRYDNIFKNLFRYVKENLLPLIVYGSLGRELDDLLVLEQGNAQSYHGRLKNTSPIPPEDIKP
jgi:hypothetical protein